MRWFRTLGLGLLGAVVIAAPTGAAGPFARATATAPPPVAAAPAAASPTNPVAPFFGVVPMSGPGKTFADPVLVPDGAGFLAAAVRYDGVAGPNSPRRVWVTRWTPSRGWSPAVAVSGRLGPAPMVTAVSNGSRAVVAWYHSVALSPGNDVGVLQIAERSSFSAAWSAPATIDALNPGLHSVVLSGDAAMAVFSYGSGYAASVETSAGAGWSAPHPLATNAQLAGAVARPGGGVVVAWSPAVVTGTGSLAYDGILSSVWTPTGGWETPVNIADPAATSCTGGVAGGSVRVIAVLDCSAAGQHWVAAREFGTAGWSAPVVVVPASPVRPIVSNRLVVGGVAALQYSRDPRGDDKAYEVRVVRSDIGGAWSTPELISITWWPVAAMAVAGGTVVTAWTAPFGKTSRVLVRTWPAGGSLSPSRWLSPPGKAVFVQAVAGSPAGAVVGWQVYGPRPWQVQAATWTPGGGWSVARQLSVNGVQAFGPELAVAGTSVAAGWYGPTGIRLATGSLADPRPRGSARVTVTGRILRCLAPAYVPRPAALTYRWLRGTTPIAGATRSTFTVPTSLLRVSLRCRVVGLTTGFRPGLAYSPPVRVMR